MKDINKAILIGRLGADPIQRHTKTGVPVTHFSVATTRRIVRDEGEAGGEQVTAEETQWHRVVTWGRQAETCAQYLKKGNPVYVEGSIRSHQYEDKSGKNRLSFEIQAENVSFLGSRRPDNSDTPTDGQTLPVQTEPVSLEMA